MQWKAEDGKWSDGHITVHYKVIDVNSMETAMGTQGQQVEGELKRENFQKTTAFPDLQCGLQFFGFHETVNALIVSHCVRLGKRESC